MLHLDAQRGALPVPAIILGFGDKQIAQRVPRLALGSDDVLSVQVIALDIDVLMIDCRARFLNLLDRGHMLLAFTRLRRSVL
jgi:hypothetical protein